ncbi:putative RDD family membrane protein YckC [Catenuloplanes nepalensis]|uniref:RDD family membrane protein YckC n=1 Tax=Catenuloplanes nepalensis TaxID=587533 RepID=A0ABT9N881_9ACTN|nr:RDD family protein [Catenuloplanes nepalensis]MDP9799914.1 putative RDD family membrane protein YckC [Catenuloplanes nepalensis]
MTFSGWWRRAAAYLVDSLIAAPFFLGAGLLDGTGNAALYYGLAVLGFVVWGYNRWWRAGRTGQSWGRALLGIRLVGAATERPIGPGRAVLRDLAHLLDDVILYIGYLLPLWTARRQTLADMVTGTVVIR